MANKSQITVLLVGDSSGAQKALKDAANAAAAAAAETDKAGDKIAGAGDKIAAAGEKAGAGGKKVEGFGASFAGEFTKLGASLATGAAAATAVIEGVHAAADAVVEYTAKMQGAESTILAVTHSQDALAKALAYADEQAKAGRSAYSDTVAAIAELTPTAKRANIDVLELYKTVQLLSAVNSGEGGGVAGAVVAINNALSGQWTSLQDRFNLSTSGIQKAVAEGIPPLQAINAALAQEGVTMDLVNAKSATLSNQTAILKDTVTRLLAEKTQGFFTDAAEAAHNLNEQITNQDSLLHALIDSFNGVKHAMDNLGTSAFAEGLNSQLAESQRAILQTVQAIHGDHGASDPFSKYLQGRIDDYNRILGEGAGTVKDTAQKIPAATVAGMQPTGAQTAAVSSYGSALLGAYIKGLDPTGQDIFGAVQKAVEESLKNASPEGKVDDGKLRAILPLIGQLSDEVARTGHVSEETWQQVRANLGSEAPEIRTLIADYEALVAAKQQVAAATAGVQSAEAAQKKDAADAKREEGELAAQVKIARDNQAKADKAEAANIKGLQATYKGLSDQQKQAAQDGAASLVPLNQALKDAQANGAAVAAGYAAQNEELQRQIDLNNQIVGALEHQRDVKFLAIDERLAELRGSRDKADLQEAAQLRRQRAQIERDSKPQIDLERERAQVANYGLEQQQKGVQAAAKTAADANAATIAGIQKQIDTQTEANRVAAAGWQKRLDAQQKLIDGATTDAQNRHDADQERIDAQQQLYDDTKAFWDGRAEADGQAVTDAQAVQKAAEATQTAAEGTLAAWQKTIAALADAGLLGRHGGGTVDSGYGIGAGAAPQGGVVDSGYGTGAVALPPPPGAPPGAPSNYAGPGPGPGLYLGTDGKLHPYAPGGAGGYQIPDGNSGAGGDGTSTTQQTIQINAYGVGEAELLNRMTAAIQRVGAA